MQEEASIFLSLSLRHFLSASRLECSEECAVLERNRRLAAALQIPNADVSGRAGPPSYSEFLREEARRNPAFLSSLHQKLTELVQTARQVRGTRVNKSIVF